VSYGRSSIGRAADSKSAGWGFESLRPCLVGEFSLLRLNEAQVRDWNPTVTQNSGGTFWSELASAGLYKRSQGRLARRLTGVGIAAIVILGAWSFQVTFATDASAPIKYGLPGLVALLGCWVAFRVIHHDKFAEFLIATEIEVEKVHWPDRQHVQRASIVVIVTMLMMGAMLFIFDMIWRYVFSLIGFLQFVD
jgi:preprotein translocase subunit SecE